MEPLSIVYTIRGCTACARLIEQWGDEGVSYEERRADLSQKPWTRPVNWEMRCPSLYTRTGEWKEDSGDDGAVTSVDGFEDGPALLTRCHNLLSSFGNVLSSASDVG